MALAALGFSQNILLDHDCSEQITWWAASILYTGCPPQILLILFFITQQRRLKASTKPWPNFKPILWQTFAVLHCRIPGFVKPNSNQETVPNGPVSSLCGSLGRHTHEGVWEWFIRCKRPSLWDNTSSPFFTPFLKKSAAPAPQSNGVTFTPRSGGAVILASWAKKVAGVRGLSFRFTK